MIYKLIIKNSGEIQILKKKIPKILIKTNHKINNWYKEKDRKVLYSDKPIDLKTAINYTKNIKEE